MPNSIGVIPNAIAKQPELESLSGAYRSRRSAFNNEDSSVAIRDVSFLEWTCFLT
jgi:hypothetical protein